MMREPHEIYDAAIDAVNVKRVSQALGYSQAHTYRLRQPPVAVDTDGSGARTDLDRIEALADLLAAYPAGRPVLEDMRLWFGSLFDRVLGTSRAHPITETSLLNHIASVMREVSELVGSADPRDLSPESRRRVRREAVDVLAALQAFVCDLDAEEEGDQQDRRLRPTG